MHKSLLAAYAAAPDTWTLFCRVGNLSDFRAHGRYRVGSFGNLDGKTENNEFKHKTISDAVKETNTLTTKGNLIGISREMIINDDLGGFMDLVNSMGRAAKRTVEADVYALLAANPAMSDTNALFHASHGNLAGSGAAVSATTLSAARNAMQSQTDISGNDYLDIQPAIFVGGLAARDAAAAVNAMEFDDESNKNQRKPNITRGMFREVVGSPRISGNEWYVFADPMDAPVIEVGFLDGNQDPYLEMKEGFTQDGVLYKVRLDYGVAAIGYEGGYKNPGA
jgi:phage major head subunit gpT-like protein